jgi:hypothetical protein
MVRYPSSLSSYSQLLLSGRELLASKSIGSMNEAVVLVDKISFSRPLFN